MNTHYTKNGSSEDTGVCLVLSSLISDEEMYRTLGLLDFQSKRNGDGPHIERRKIVRNRRHQRGSLWARGKTWFLRYYDDVMGVDGQLKRKMIVHRLATKQECPLKRDAQQLAEEYLAPINVGHVTASSTIKLNDFVEHVYLQHVERECRPSTAAGYRDMWRCHVKPRCGKYRLRDFHTWDGERLMQEISREKKLGRNSLKHIKAFLSGVFKHAKRQGFFGAENPMRDVSIPKAPEPKETYAYSLEEITQMLAALPPEIGVVVATAAFTGVRRGELRGFRWEDYDGKEIRVSRSVWRDHVSDPKTAKSKAPVPVVAPLAALLEKHRAANGNPSTGLMFKSSTGNSLDLADLARRLIRPALKKAGLEWHGWHAFRRGLATNLYRLGVSDKTIQAILRHSNLATTMNSYVKSVPEDTASAMRDLENVLCTKYAQKPVPEETYVM